MHLPSLETLIRALAIVLITWMAVRDCRRADRALDEQPEPAKVPVRPRDPRS